MTNISNEKPDLGDGREGICNEGEEYCNRCGKCTKKDGANCSGCGNSYGTLQG